MCTLSVSLNLLTRTAGPHFQAIHPSAVLSGLVNSAATSRRIAVSISLCSAPASCSAEATAASSGFSSPLHSRSTSCVSLDSVPSNSASCPFGTPRPGAALPIAAAMRQANPRIAASVGRSLGRRSATAPRSPLYNRSAAPTSSGAGSHFSRRSAPAKAARSAAPPVVAGDAGPPTPLGVGSGRPKGSPSCTVTPGIRPTAARAVWALPRPLSPSTTRCGGSSSESESRRDRFGGGLGERSSRVRTALGGRSSRCGAGLALKSCLRGDTSWETSCWRKVHRSKGSGSLIPFAPLPDLRAAIKY
eukprot:Hpha_TRINITY_DN26568_c0_g1::TRINITY_DN26568_c0_g1_i1::g.112897::m.112897